jgi:hypothetical protein
MSVMMSSGSKESSSLPSVEEVGRILAWSDRNPSVLPDAHSKIQGRK